MGNHARSGRLVMTIGALLPLLSALQKRKAQFDEEHWRKSAKLASLLEPFCAVLQHASHIIE